MKPLQVYLDDAELKRLSAFAKDHGWSKSEAVRVAIRALAKPVATDSVLQLSGMVRGLPRDFAAKFQRYMGETFDVAATPEKTARKRRARSRR